jgi:hypothetical protein
MERRMKMRIADFCGRLAHRLRYGTWNHHPAYKHPKEIIEDSFGDVHELENCHHCGQPYLGKLLGNVLLEDHDGEVVYTGMFKADRLKPYEDQGYVVTGPRAA